MACLAPKIDKGRALQKEDDIPGHLVAMERVQTYIAVGEPSPMTAEVFGCL